MRRGAKSRKPKVEAKLPVTAKSRKNEGSRVRDLETRLAEALEQQTATAEILRVISSSPTEIQPVLDAVAQSAMRLCAAYDAVIFQLESNVLRVVAHHGPIPFRSGELAGRGTLPGRAMLEGRAIHVADLQAESEEFPVSSAVARELGFRTAVKDRKSVVRGRWKILCDGGA